MIVSTSASGYRAVGARPIRNQIKPNDTGRQPGRRAAIPAANASASVKTHPASAPVRQSLKRAQVGVRPEVEGHEERPDVAQRDVRLCDQ